MRKEPKIIEAKGERCRKNRRARGARWLIKSRRLIGFEKKKTKDEREKALWPRIAG
jgi:uncharacterized protein (DUF2342 family)